MQLSIIIVNYNVKYFLEQCLYSLRKCIGHLEAEVLVIDNASSDGSIEYLSERFPEVVLIVNTENAGFAKANNQGLLRATGRYILFLNPDTILAEDCLQHCLHFMESHPCAGACGVRMVDGNGQYLPESKRGFPSFSTSFYKLSGLTSLLPRSRKFAGYYLGHLSESENQEVDILSGAFLLTRKQVLAETGGFDEQFFMYGEDIDLSYRIQQAGYKNYYLASTSIIHYKGKSTRKGSLNYVKLFYKAMHLFVRKHYKGFAFQGFPLLIRLFILFRAGVSVTGSFALKKPAVNGRDVLNTWVIGNESEATAVIKLLQKQSLSQKIVTIAEPGSSLTRDAAMALPDEIILCEGLLSFKDIILLIQELPKSVSIKIHSRGSDSVTGNDPKNGNGNLPT